MKERRTNRDRMSVLLRLGSLRSGSRLAVEKLTKKKTSHTPARSQAAGSTEPGCRQRLGEGSRGVKGWGTHRELVLRVSS